MPTRLNPHLSFDGTAREAMELYRDVFGGELEVHTYGEQGDPHGEDAGRVMHARLTTPQGYVLMAADQAEQLPLTHGDNVQISLSGDDPALREQFVALARGGHVVMPLAAQAWGDEFGMLVDRFGIHWMVNLMPPTA